MYIEPVHGAHNLPKTGAPAMPPHKKTRTVLLEPKLYDWAVEGCHVVTGEGVTPNTIVGNTHNHGLFYTEYYAHGAKDILDCKPATGCRQAVSFQDSAAPQMWEQFLFKTLECIFYTTKTLEGPRRTAVSFDSQPVWFAV